jgi:hypothetical protein
MLSLALLLLASPLAAAAGSTTRHEIQARLDPAAGTIAVVDRITLARDLAVDAAGGYRFLLHAGLALEVEGEGWQLERVAEEVGAAFVGINASSETAGAGVPLEGWRLRAGNGAGQPVVLRYGGVIRHELATSGEEYQRSFSETPGLIGSDGVFLAGASYWLPVFGEQLVTFSLEVSGLQPPWDVVSQGRRIRHELTADGTRTTAWLLEHPTEEVYLVAGPWHEYSDTAYDVEVLAFLRDDDPALAGSYLQATRRYLRLYESLLPAYPYPSFALVENFWETGYGMPGFTLLGPRIIRFPWILTSSYPHELLHNWWGNSVYVDFDGGNWCEGLTAYLADHLFAEQRGEAATYRRATLKKYTDFVSSGNDFPLADFRSRRSAASEAVGYGKSLMVFHMVRRAIGDEAFLKAMSRFFTFHTFQRATFDDIAGAVETVTGGDWRPFFAAWTGRAGAPQLEIQEVAALPSGNPELPWTIRLELRQTQAGEPFTFTVPVAVTLEGRDEPLWVEAGSCHRDCVVEIPCPARPLRLDVDPAFDVMRRLDPLEVPPALSTVFGAAEPLYVLPSAASEDERAAWRALAEAWVKPGQPRIALDSELAAMPETAAWVLGWGNRFAPELAGRLAEHGVTLDSAGLRLGADSFGSGDHSIVLVARSAADPAEAIGWIAASTVDAIPGLARKLPHYTRYSYLAFAGGEPENVAKGMWQPLTSPLVRALGDGELPPLVLPSRPPLAELPSIFDAADLELSVIRLSELRLEGRGLGSPGLDEATAWVEGRFSEIGLQPAGDDGFRQSWSWTGGEPERLMTLTNLAGRLPGSDPSLANQPVVVLAHLDHLGRGWPDVRSGNEGLIHPGADDNASGVAVLLELARAMAVEPPRPRPVLFAVVTGEEAGRLGSRKLIESLRTSGSPLACLNLDTVGRLADGKLYVLNTDSAREWRFLFMGVGHTIGTTIEVVAEPLDSSDQMSCIEAGVPGVQLLTGPNADYHRPTDTADRIDGKGMAVVADVARETVAYLAERTEPLTVTISGAATAAPPADGEPRRASLGTMPDFAFAGPGVRVQEVVPGSPAATAGVRAGDVLVALDGLPIADLRGYSAALKARQPGDPVELTVRRDGEEKVLTATLGER